ncbi:hypothetical protein LRX75_08230 [Rhizobium sp. DKSPLA3]|uniref:Uncharacterized protein n=1 Tax=Rhizobium quercicola TaxID=2901226 RepID=A0A9X1T0F6_9HYPH|nr:hypothetical protein [Rhizobium quercicola]MCD7109029.1 hypothetical protein [Rhizobium quercicola]
MENKITNFRVTLSEIHFLFHRLRAEMERLKGNRGIAGESDDDMAVPGR